eukprot:4867280-Amphidinium_carterae.1
MMSRCRGEDAANVFCPPSTNASEQMGQWLLSAVLAALDTCWLLLSFLLHGTGASRQFQQALADKKVSLSFSKRACLRNQRMYNWLKASEAEVHTSPRNGMQ